VNAQSAVLVQIEAIVATVATVVTEVVIVVLTTVATVQSAVRVQSVALMTVRNSTIMRIVNRKTSMIH
jgi:hypothetical protein